MNLSFKSKGVRRLVWFKEGKCNVWQKFHFHHAPLHLSWWYLQTFIDLSSRRFALLSEITLIFCSQNKIPTLWWCHKSARLCVEMHLDLVLKCHPVIWCKFSTKKLRLDIGKDKAARLLKRKKNGAKTSKRARYKNSLSCSYLWK